MNEQDRQQEIRHCEQMAAVCSEQDSELETMALRMLETIRLLRSIDCEAVDPEQLRTVLHKSADHLDAIVSHFGQQRRCITTQRQQFLDRAAELRAAETPKG